MAYATKRPKISRVHPTPPGAARKEVRVYSGSGALLSKKSWRVKKMSSKKPKKVVA